MNKSKYVFIAITTFLVGISGYCACFFLRPVKIDEIKNIIPLYEVEKNPELYVAHKFLMHENIIVTKDDRNDVRLNYFIQGRREKCKTFPGCQADYISCNFTERISFVRFVESNEVSMIKKIAEKNTHRFEDDSKDTNKTYGAEVEIEGYVDKLDDFDHYFKINVTSIKQISPIKVISEEGNKFTD